MQDNGLIACAKHFPGDGYCDYDQHLTTAVNPLSKEEWDKSFGYLYEELINRGVKTIMPGHISLPAYDSIDEETGAYRPATLSKNLLTELLKKKLGFEGIIVSDALNMGGFCGYMNYYRGCAEFLEAGGDVLLFAHPTDDFIEGVMQYVENGFLKRETLEDRACRVLSFAKEHQNCISHETYDRDEHQKIADEITKKAIIIERDRNHILPFTPTKGMKILYYIISAAGEEKIDERMVEELKKYADVVDKASDLGPDGILGMVKSNEYDLVICRVNPMQSYGINSVRLSGTIARNMMSGWQKYDTPVVFVTHSTSLAHEYEVAIDTLINTRGYSLNSARFIAEKIFG